MLGVDVSRWCSWRGGPVGHRPSTATEEDGKIVGKGYLVAYAKARGGSLWAGGDHVQETAVRQNIFQTKI